MTENVDGGQHCIQVVHGLAHTPAKSSIGSSRANSAPNTMEDAALCQW